MGALTAGELAGLTKSTTSGDFGAALLLFFSASCTASAAFLIQPHIVDLCGRTSQRVFSCCWISCNLTPEREILFSSCSCNQNICNLSLVYDNRYDTYCIYIYSITFFQMIANNAVLSVSCFPVQSYVHCTKDNDFYNLMHKCTDLCDTSLLWGTCTCNCKIIIPVSAISMTMPRTMSEYVGLLYTSLGLGGALVLILALAVPPILPRWNTRLCDVGFLK